MMRSAERLLEQARGRIERERAAILDLVQHHGEAQLESRPRSDAWSPLEILEHLALVEDSILQLLAPAVERHEPRCGGGGLAALIRALPPRWRLVLLAHRFGKASAPKAVRPRGMSTRAAIIERLAAVRQATRATLDADDPWRLAQLRRTHPILGRLDGIEWIEFIAAHDRRHRGQLREALSASSAPRE